MKSSKKHYMRWILIPLLSIIAIVVVWFVIAFIWSMQYNKSQRAMTDGLPGDFSYSTDLIRDPNGYFGFVSSINGQAPDTFLLDTQASSLATSEMLERMKAEYDGRKPMPNFNFYGQMYFPKLYGVVSMTIGTANLKGALFNEVGPDNGMYTALYRPVIGRNILQDFIWKFDLDTDSVTVFSNKNKDMLDRYAKGYVKFEDGINTLPVEIGDMPEESFMVDLGSNYDVIIDKEMYERLAKKSQGRRILYYRDNERVDTVTEFLGVDVRIGNLDFSDCSVVYLPSVDRNIIGQRFMGRCNFILSYEMDQDGYNKEDLCLRKSKKDNKVLTLVPRIGFGVGFRGPDLFVTLLDPDSPMAKAGLKPGMKVLSINNGSLPTDIVSVNSGLTESLLSRARRVSVTVAK